MDGDTPIIYAANGVYKYRQNIKIKDLFRDIDTLLNDGIYASAFVNLNDPFEATYCSYPRIAFLVFID